MKSIFNNHYKTADTGDPWEGFVAMVLYSHWLTHSRNVIRALKTRVLRKSSLRPRTVMDMRFTIGSAETKITTIKRRHRQSSSSQSRLCRRFHTNLAPAYLHTGLIQHPLKEIRHKWSSAWRIFLLHHHFLLRQFFIWTFLKMIFISAHTPWFQKSGCCQTQIYPRGHNEPSLRCGLRCSAPEKCAVFLDVHVFESGLHELKCSWVQSCGFVMQPVLPEGSEVTDRLSESLTDWFVRSEATNVLKQSEEPRLTLEPWTTETRSPVANEAVHLGKLQTAVYHDWMNSSMNLYKNKVYHCEY